VRADRREGADLAFVVHHEAIEGGRREARGRAGRKVGQACHLLPEAIPGYEVVIAADELDAACPIDVEPGDIILTGTPEGVGQAMDPPRYLATGDVVRLEVESLGAIEHTIAIAE